jgi:hypothetical protein
MLAVLKFSLVFSLVVVTDEPLEELPKADSHIECRARAVPLPCRATEGLERVFPI